MKINDLVLMIRPMNTYSGYHSFFEKHNLSMDMASRYAYFESPKFHGIYRVVFSVTDEKSNKVVIEEVGMARRIYIVDKKAIVKIGKVCDDYLEVAEPHYNGVCLDLRNREED